MYCWCHQQCLAFTYYWNSFFFCFGPTYKWLIVKQHMLESWVFATVSVNVLPENFTKSHWGQWLGCWRQRLEEVFLNWTFSDFAVLCLLIYWGQIRTHSYARNSKNLEKGFLLKFHEIVEQNKLQQFKDKFPWFWGGIWGWLIFFK